jgi:hypothetical protein
LRPVPIEDALLVFAAATFEEVAVELVVTRSHEPLCGDLELER